MRTPGLRPHLPAPPVDKGESCASWIACVPAVAILIATSVLFMPAARADEPPPDSPLVKLLKSGRVPEARQGAIVDMIGKRGTAGDIAFLFQQVISPDGFSAPIKLKALEALAEAASNRNLRPANDVDKLVALVQSASSRSEPALQKAAVRLAGLWKLEAAAESLEALAVSPSSGRRAPLRSPGRTGLDRRPGGSFPDRGPDAGRLSRRACASWRSRPWPSSTSTPRPSGPP